jgi:N-acetylmuramoyl-L-alanine amidase
MLIESVKLRSLKLLLIIGLIFALASFASIAAAQEEQPEVAEEAANRNFVSLEQRQEEQQRQFDYSQRCEDSHFIILGGESLGHITSNCDIPLDWILAVNPQIGNPDLVFAGEAVRLPPADADPRTMPFLTSEQHQYLADTGFQTAFVAEGEEPDAEPAAVEVIIPDTGSDEFTQEARQRMFASDSQRREARQMQFDYDWRCEQDQFVILGGESLGHIARNCGVPLDYILAVNPQIGYPDLVFSGELVNVPDADIDPSTMPLLTSQQAQYLSDRFGIAMAEGEIADPVIPETGSTEFAQEAGARRLASDAQIRQAEAQRFDYAQRCEQGEFVILRGETLGHITANCGIPLDWILAVNRHISYPDLVFAGELVTLPDPDTDPATLPFLTESQLDYLQQTGLAGEPIEAEEVEEVDDNNDVEDEETEENDS